MNGRNGILRAAGIAVGIVVIVLVVLQQTGVIHYLGMDAYRERVGARLAAERAPAAVAPTGSAGASGAAATSTSAAIATVATDSGSHDITGDAPHTDFTEVRPASVRGTGFHPPPESAMPKGEFGDVIRAGRAIFTDTPRAAAGYVGNSMRCSSCHLDAGRLANSAPLWAAFVSYPAYRSKTKSVSSFQQRLQGCFQFSMNGKAPPLGAPELVALESYSYWLASGAPVDPKIEGRGYPKLPKPAQPPDYARGEQVYTQHCALCHGVDGNGQRTPGGYTVFPALWGADSFNWGAGMGRISNAAAFIRANMPLGLGGSLSEQQAWDVAAYMDSHDRPQDPRFKGTVAATRSSFHDTADSMYGKTVDGKVLGAGKLAKAHDARR